MLPEYDFVVIGGGMAGSAVAAHLAAHASVRLLDMEPHPGYHSTGRSAATFSEAYGNAPVRALTRASREHFFSPPATFSSIALVKPRQVLITARVGQENAFDGLLSSIASNGELVARSPAQAVALCPVLRADELIGAALSPNAADIEVHELQHGYLRFLKSRGGTVSMSSQVTAIDRDGTGWLVTTNSGTLRAATLINAAGAWAGEIARLADAQSIDLQSFKRTACLIEPPQSTTVHAWPMLVDVEEQFYLKPDAGMLLLSPADETATNACDAQADDLDIAIAVDRLETATTLQVKRIVRRWAGLRTFVADRTPVVGFDGRRPTFFWLAALGGFGIQTAPAISQLAASLALNRPIDARLLDYGVDPATLSPRRLV